ncbi:MAG TPA: SpoIIE family protein phosphatase [Bacteroidales bacterium]|jgi:serine phosphatase RsbU (regulator of sigma subunit)|nr:SpoIIE family protein phosphatase [Bacteroidales bacterium]
MATRKTTIFRQLIFNIAIPTLLAFLVIAVLNFQRTRSILSSASEEKNTLLSNEVTKILKFQDFSFKLIEDELSTRMKELNYELAQRYFSHIQNPEKINLTEILKKLQMDPANEDIYIIDRNGVVVNTTFKGDYGVNLYSYGEQFKSYLQNIFESGEFVVDLFAIEARTSRPKKYSYLATADRKYIIELGAYSKRADEIISMMEDVKTQLKREIKGIMDVELFFMADKPFSMNKTAFEVKGQEEYLLNAFQKKDTTAYVQRLGGKWLQYQYIYMERRASNLYKGSVIRIISDITEQQALFRKEALRFILIFGITMIILAYMIYEKTKVITLPIKKLVENVDRITNGDLRERAEVTGNNEITRLTEKFNMMIAQLESYTYELEEKVKERTKKIEQQKEKIEEQKKHITDSIFYARRIQNAILPSFQLIDRNLKEYFILYMPKDIVSGDFYWMNEADGLFMIAAVDCTGHGVPGAFMSIVGFNQLNHAVNVRKARKASEILDTLNEGVISTLNENKSEGSIKDGMDLALCIFDFKNRRAEFAGANNPLIIIRNNEIMKYRGDRFPIGAFDGAKPQKFKNNEIELHTGDCFYFFSDGYEDQFGGPEGKKFMARRFEELLKEISHFPVPEQKKMLTGRLAEWMGSNEQVDDILVIGIKV